MPFGDILESAGPPRRILRINQVVPEWEPGEVYEAHIKFTLLEMDTNGMTADVTEINLEEGSSHTKDGDRGAQLPQVVPSPS